VSSEPGIPLHDWLAGGERVLVELPADSASQARAFHIFCRVEGSGPWVTFLHGFPTSSWDWASVAPHLAPNLRLLLPDFLGFGDSDKPPGHRYSLFEQADIVEALWRRFAVSTTALVAHDYGDTVAQELLHRHRAGRLPARVSQAIFLNGGLYPGVHRPLLIQTLLENRMTGALVNLLLSERVFRRNFSAVLSAQHPVSDSELKQHWQAITRHNGRRNYHRLIQYMGERRRHRERWVTALENAGVPLRFLWGMDDPISGAPMAHEIRSRLPSAELVELKGVGHYPQLEVPGEMAKLLIQRLLQ